MRLEQYAGICAALVAGFPLPAALANDALDRRAWGRAAPAWAAKLSRETAGAPLKSAFDRRLAEAESCLGRRVEPLEDDIESWLLFLRAWSSDTAPDALLTRLKLRPADISRIQRRWAVRMEADEKLRKRAMELAAKKPSGLPAIKVVPAELRPFPWSDKAVVPASESTAAPPLDGFAGGLSLPEIAVLLPSFMLAPSAAPAPLPSFLIGGNMPSLSVPVSPLPAFSSGRPAALLAGETALVFEIPRGPITPFSADRASPVVSRTAPVRAPRMPAPAPMGETAVAFELPRAPVTPFVTGPLAGPSASRPGASPAGAKWLSASIGETLGVFELPARPEMPFRADPPPARAQESPPIRPEPEAPRALAPGGTVADLELPKRPVVPFSPPVSEGVPAKGISTPIGETVVTFELPRSMVLPFSRPGDHSSPGVPAVCTAPLPITPPALLSAAAAAPRPVTPTAAPPAAMPPPVSPEPSPPALTLEQHASLSAELALYPALVAETLARYGVTPETKRLLDRRYAEMGAAKSDVHTAWERAYRTYYQWLLGQPRRRG